MSKLRVSTVGVLAAVLAMALSVQAAPPPDAGDLKARLTKALKADDRNAVGDVLVQLIEVGGAEAIDVVLKYVPKFFQAPGSGHYWSLVNSAAAFRDTEALSKLGEFILDNAKAPYARDLMFALESNASPNTTAAQVPVLNEGPYDLQLMAADQLANVATTKSIDALIETLKKEGDKGDPELRRRVMASLSSLTKENMGDALNWIGWWEANRDKGVPEAHEDTPTAGQFASSTMNRDRKQQFESLKKEKDRILVISARRPKDDPKQPNYDYNYDHMERILAGMGIPHKVVLKAKFEENPKKYLKRAWTILINCNNIQRQCICAECKKNVQKGAVKNRLFSCPPDCPSGHDNVCFRMQPPTIKAIKKWVEKGGYLFTEDWGVVEVVEEAWPELINVTLTIKRGRNPQGEENPPLEERTLVRTCDVGVVPARGVTSLPIMRGVFSIPRPPARADDDGHAGGTRTRDPGPPVEHPSATYKAHWKIDDESPAIHIVDKARVKILLESEDLAKKTKQIREEMLRRLKDSLQGDQKRELTKELAKQPPEPNYQGDKAVAVTFRAGKAKPKKPKGARKGPVTGGGRLTGKSRGKGAWGERLAGGRVLHCISHFGKQQGGQRDTFVIQNLILNFIMESNANHGGF